MNKKFVLVSELTVIKKVVLGAGMVITMFSCTEDVKACDTFMLVSRQTASSETLRPSISANFEVTLAINTDDQITDRNVASVEGGIDNVLEQFVSTILTETKPLDGDISKFVDDNFWDLV